MLAQVGYLIVDDRASRVSRKCGKSEEGIQFREESGVAVLHHVDLRLAEQDQVVPQRNGQTVLGFAIVQSYLSTAVKWGIGRYDALKCLFTTGPWIPHALTPDTAAA
ncbi:hypothetical protein [Streptomyces atratus]|uniref:hypothetical protein n=1 Tax=Streptomyces atratus TaxID=1893 RepID=UPI00225B4A6D|nr:hypothetical protein [Streptomyces atratus]MCX5342979.1 hypothetical protein [Streptomyces atratus]